MSELKKDILVGLLFIVGVFVFMAGEFIVSTLVFATAAIFSNIHFNLKQNG
ncbi:hypothetical protein Q9L42_009250 [Methylomarinum sp. Ch1-1]|uniref:Uncharacterized protein n=1 Tax=Methylomarinum roseum TaxID=3067653 RepID=A0AAU7P0I7_9GAMM|nr:hypothetical protein [Methylomarinum sp. Ch1-1]MDP4521580.1 hypothetical protein [Methylomarinum sp. Ch1-1]